MLNRTGRSRIIVAYSGMVKIDQTDTITTWIQIGEDKILWGIWSIFERIRKNKKMQFDLQRWIPNKKKWQFWNAGRWDLVASYFGKVKCINTEDGEHVNEIIIGGNQILHGGWSIFEQCDGDFVCLTTEEVEE